MSKSLVAPLETPATFPDSQLNGTFFVTGTDTEIGKTWVTCRLLERAQQRGLSCFGLKPLAAGCEATAAGLRNDDAQALLHAASIKLAYDQVNPVALLSPIAPHIAAVDAGVAITAAGLAKQLRETLQHNPADLILIEGAGGWAVPLNGDDSWSDLVALLQLPVILVVGMKLGCINHARLSAAAIMASGASLVGWVANDLGDPMSRYADNLATLEALMPVARISID